jgi:hypothetical protein
MYRLGALILGYVLGGIQTAILYSRLKGMDIRQHGSGNAGATNTLRVMGKKAALFVFLGDILKAGVAVLIVKSLYPEQALVAALYAGVGSQLSVVLWIQRWKRYCRVCRRYLHDRLSHRDHRRASVFDIRFCDAYRIDKFHDADGEYSYRCGGLL